MTPPLIDPLAGLETATDVLHSQGRLASRIRGVRVVVGTALVLSAIGLAGYFWIFTATSEAIVSGRAVTLAAPIAGLVERFDLDVGDPVEPGQVLARIHNERVDLSRLDNLRGQRASLLSRLAAVHAEVANKSGERDRQQVDFEQQAGYEESDLVRQVQEAETSLASLTASRTRCEIDFKALTELFDRKLIARVDHEHAREALVVSSKAVDAQALSVGRLQSRLRAVRAGLLIGTVVPAQKARLEDLSTRLAELQVSLRELTANTAALDAEIASEQTRGEALVEATLVSPVRGYVWKRAANAGQHVVAGTELVEVVDAATIQIEAYFHQRSLPDVGVGDVAMVSPVGSRDHIRGTVRWIGADASAQAAAVAPQWNPKQDTAMRVLLSISDHDRRLVWVGQRVTVAVSRSPGGAWGLGDLFAALVSCVVWW